MQQVKYDFIDCLDLDYPELRETVVGKIARVKSVNERMHSVANRHFRFYFFLKMIYYYQLVIVLIDLIPHLVVVSYLVMKQFLIVNVPQDCLFW